MLKKSLLGSAIALAIAAPAMAEVEVSAILKNETAVFFKQGIRTGEATNSLDTKGDGRKLGKFENSARIFFNGDIGEESTWHGELNLIYDAAAESGYKGHKNYTQNDWLRELYVDTTAGGWDLRLGKQQVVWGTADGIKLLDIINPTDYRELVQNTMEDARIPVWMINAERNVGENGNIQLIVSQAEENKIPGLTNEGDRTAAVIYNNPMGGVPSDNSQLQGAASGHPFIMKGVDTITGKVNGFFNIGAAMGAVTTTFWGGGFTDPAANPTSELATVGGFTAAPAGACAASGMPATYTGAGCLEAFTEMTNQQITNLIDVTDPTTGAGWDTANPNSTWEYMPNATFATFNTYVGMTTRYDRKYDGDINANFGARYRGNLDNGLNFGLNYFYAYDPNPVVNIHWEDPTTRQQLAVSEYTTNAGTTVVQLTDVAGPGATKGYGGNATYTPGNYPTGTPGVDMPHDVGGAGLTNAGSPVLVFEEKLTRVHNIGGSFDYAFDSGDMPWVVRGEFLYQKDVHQPIVDRDALARGNLTAALTTKESDFIKYVIGLDTTVMTNLMASFQFIQFINLDFVDSKKNCTTQAGVTINCSRYTANPATLHLTNGLQKGRKTQEFYSLFLSKPFGESDLGRWNNIIIYEEGGGFWDRLDAEYSLSDQLVVTGEVNMYWGDQDTQFGQFKNSSNVQVGLKYIIE